jgi:hypothetical protein
VGDAAGAGLVEVGDDHGAGALSGEPQRQRPPDAAGAASDDGDRSM